MMLLFKTFISGFQKTLRSIKFVLLAWVATFILGSIFAFPVKAGLKMAAGSSMVLDRTQDGILIDIFADMGRSFKTITFMGLSGLILVVVAGFMVNAFFTRGIFGVMRYNTGKARFSEFFSHTSENYWSFLGISVLLRFVIFILSLIMIIIPLSALGPGQSLNLQKAIVTASVSAVCFLFVIPVLILVSDYARAWLVVHPSASFWKSVGSGFSITFNRFFLSYFYVMLLCGLQSAFFVLSFSLMGDWKPTGVGTLIFIIAFQVVFVAGIFMRYWRFAGIISLVEQIVPVASENVKEDRI